MGKARKRHVQQDLIWSRRGGARPGAGRPPRGPRSSEPHKKRPAHNSRHPAFVTIRVADDIPSLRTRDMHLAIREATKAVAEREGFSIIELSIQRTHLHLIVEAADEVALARGMQAFQISAAKRINAILVDSDGRHRHGSVFPDHYHPRALTTPREVRNVLSYVFNNWRRHREDQREPSSGWLVDPFSTAIGFDGWAELGWGERFVPRSSYLALTVKRATTWLLTTGWKRHGPISYFEVPGPQPR